MVLTQTGLKVTPSPQPLEVGASPADCAANECTKHHKPLVAYNALLC